MPVVHSSASAFSTAGVLRGQGPSSKVSTTSLSRRKSSSLKCSKPKPGPPVVSISTVRPIPSAFGLLQGGCRRCLRRRSRTLGGRQRLCPRRARCQQRNRACKDQPCCNTHLFFPKLESRFRRCRRPVCLQPLIHSTLVGARAPRQRLSSQRICRRTASSGDVSFLTRFRPHESLSASLGNVLRQRPRDSGFDPGVHRFDRFREYVRDVAIPADQVFVEVPAWNILRPRLRRPFV